MKDMILKLGLCIANSLGRLYSVDWTRDWTRDWTVGLDSQKVALIILKHQNTTTYLHDMNGIWGSRP